jgi:hypothetical protein
MQSLKDRTVGDTYDDGNDDSLTDLNDGAQLETRLISYSATQVRCYW